MNSINQLANMPIIKDTKGTTLVSGGHLIAAALACVVFYYMIPERKRKQGLFK